MATAKRDARLQGQRLPVSVRRIIALAALSLIVAVPTWAANDFSGDTACKALYRLESGALTTDSTGNGNTLTNTGVVTADTLTFKEGAASGNWGYLTDSMKIADASLSAGFPFKSGDSTKKLSVCFWVYMTGTTNRAFVGQGVSGSTYTFLFRNEVGTGVNVRIGYGDGTTYETVTGPSVPNIQGNWCHVGATYQDSDRSWKIRVWDELASSVSQTSGTTTNAIYIGANGWGIGNDSSGAAAIGGYLDEVVFFNDILTSAEIDQIRQGIYGASSTAIDWWWRRRHSQLTEKLFQNPLSDLLKVTL